MSEKLDPWPLWLANATKGDLIRVIVHMQSITTALAGAIVAMRGNDEKGFGERIGDYFTENLELEAILADIGGGKRDG